MPVSGVKALFFDVFGTLVDWRAGVAREAQLMLRRLGPAWTGFNSPTPGATNTSRPWKRFARGAGRTPSWTCCIGARCQFLPRFGLATLDETTLDQLTLAWHRLDAWQDVCRRPRAIAAAVSDRSRVERQHRSHVRPGAQERLSLGRDFGRRHCRKFQTGGRGVSRGSRRIRSQAERVHDVRRARQRPSRQRPTTACGRHSSRGRRSGRDSAKEPDFRSISWRARHWTWRLNWAPDLSGTSISWARNP